MREPPKWSMSTYSVSHPLLSMQSTIKSNFFPSDTPMQKTKFSFVYGNQLQKDPGLGILVTSPLSCRTLPRTNQWSPLYVTLNSGAYLCNHPFALKALISWVSSIPLAYLLFLTLVTECWQRFLSHPACLKQKIYYL